jgi:hypothetical protein
MTRSFPLAVTLAGAAACGTQNPVAASVAGWQVPVRLAPTEGGAVGIVRPVVVADALGRAIAVWAEASVPLPHSGDHVRAARFEPGQGWAAPVTLGSPGYFYFDGMDLKMSERGDAAIVWGDAARPTSAAFFTPGIGWSRPHVMPYPHDTYPKLSLAEDGAVLALWAGDDPSVPGAWWQRKRLWAGAISPETGWAGPQIISGSTAPFYRPFEVAADGRGNVIAVWVESAPPSLHDAPTGLWVNRLVKGVGWGRPQMLAALPHITGLATIQVALAVDPDGNAVAIWPGPGGLEASHYVADADWSTPILVGGADPHFPRLRMSARGRAVAVWNSPLGVEAADFEPGRGWSEPETQVVPGGMREFDWPGKEPDLGLDRVGSAWVAWVQDRRILAARFTAGSGWGPTTALQSTSAEAESPRIAVTPDGGALAIWAEQLPEPVREEVWSALFVPDGR